MKIFKTITLLTGAALIGALSAGCGKTQPDAAMPDAPRERVQLMHVHGLSYSPDGSKLLIPIHHGLAVFDGSGWSKAAGPQHDYMGFSATKEAIYSSGHPAPDAGLVNPFGVIKSADSGRTWQKLGLEGESDFHLLAPGYQTNTVYVVNHHQNSRMTEAGIYYTANDGFSWQRAQARDLRGNPASLAAHPSNPKVVAAGMDNGLYLSRNAGDTFEKIGAGAVTAVFFDLDGKRVWYGTADGQPGLRRIDLDGGRTGTVGLPAMQQDAVAYIAQNPARRNEYAIATFQRSVYLSQDEGKTWKQIAEKGETR